MWDLSRRDWAERLRAGRSLMPELPDLDRERAEKAIRIFKRLRIPDVVGTPTFGEACDEWFFEIVGAMLGSYDETARDRYIRELFLLVPKKNSKTTNGAGLMLTAVIMNERPRAEFLFVAPTKEVADIAFNQASGMVLADRQLRARFHLQTHLKRLTYTPTGATLQIKSFSLDVLNGVKPVGILVDEEHVIADRADAAAVMGQLRGGIISQPEGFLALITTQSNKPPRGVFRDDLIQARKIRDGELRSNVLPILYEFPPDIQQPAKLPGEAAPWENPDIWQWVLPNAGRSITVPRLLEEFQKAKAKNIEELIRWASQHLNVEIGLALRSDRWVGADYWLSAGDATLTLDALLERCDVAVAGVDGGGLDDLLSLALLGRDRETSQWLHWQRSWVFEGVLTLRKQEASKLRDIEADGDLVIVQEPGEDIEQLADALSGIEETGILAQVGMDPMGVGAIVDALVMRGIERAKIVGVSQGWTLSGAIKTAERKLADGTLLHGAREIMAWAVSNAKVEPRGNAIIITKQAAGNLKIDPLMALLNAVTLMSKTPEAPAQSIYEREGLWVS